MKAATFSDELYDCGYVISIHAAREGGDEFAKLGLEYRVISIHAAREGGDVQQPDCKPSGHISIHAAREGGDERET